VDQYLFSILFSLLLALLLSMLMVWVWTIRGLWSGRPLLTDAPCFPLREAPWGAMTVFSVVFLYLLVNGLVSRSYSATTGRHPPSAVEAKRKVHADPPAEAAKSDDPAIQSQTDLLIQLAIINGILVMLVPLLVRYTAGARFADLGLTLVDWRRQMAIGAAAALLMTPAVYAVQSVAVRIWKSQHHPVEQMVLGEFSFGIALLAIVSTVVLAPMIEELLFRGIVQRWLVKLAGPRREAPAAVIPEVSAGLSADDLLPFDVPVESCVRMDDGGVPYRTSRTTEPGEEAISAGLPIVLTSLAFASLHATQWPAPLAIFLLSMALGALYHRTGSLLAVITMHATFNGFSTLLLLLEALSRQVQADPATAKAFIVRVLVF
jgi:membrane protease YdiL (CAAX protease family)